MVKLKERVTSFPFKRRIISRVSNSKSIILFSIIIFIIYFFSSYDSCWFSFPEEPLEKGFVFSSTWTEHVHSSEEWAILHQTNALNNGRIWLSENVAPNNTVDTCRVGNRYFAVVEPMTSFLLLPFYVLGGFFFGDDYVVRSLLIGLFFYTILNALLIRKISLQLNQSTKAANLAALLFAIATMAFSYAKLLYPQPIVTMLMLATIYFLFSYKNTRDSKRLFGAFLFYGLTVVSFNAFIITAPFFLFYLYKSCRPIDRKVLLKGALAIIPSILIFTLWNFAVTGDPLMTPRQVDYHTINFEVIYATEAGTWLNVEGIVGTLFSPIGIFFVSPVLLFFIFTPVSLIKEKKMDFLLIAFLAIEFWIFFSFANLGGVAGRDWWVGGWANISRYMYFPSALLTVFAAQAVVSLVSRRAIVAAWLISLAAIFSFLANISYSIRHDTMVGLSKDIMSTSLLIWPYQMEPLQLATLIFLVGLASFIVPLFLFLKYKHTEFLRR